VADADETARLKCDRDSVLIGIATMLWPEPVDAIAMEALRRAYSAGWTHSLKEFNSRLGGHP
jgi:hypothetical protein